MSFNERRFLMIKNHYLFTYFKNCVLREDGRSYRTYYTFIYATSAFTNSFERTPRDQRLALGLDRYWYRVSADTCQ